jgi:hypothetical protein
MTTHVLVKERYVQRAHMRDGYGRVVARLVRFRDGHVWDELSEFGRYWLTVWLRIAEREMRS